MRLRLQRRPRLRLQLQRFQATSPAADSDVPRAEVVEDSEDDEPLVVSTVAVPKGEKRSAEFAELAADAAEQRKRRLLKPSHSGESVSERDVDAAEPEASSRSKAAEPEPKVKPAAARPKGGPKIAEGKSKAAAKAAEARAEASAKTKDAPKAAEPKAKPATRAKPKNKASAKARMPPMLRSHRQRLPSLSSEARHLLRSPRRARRIVMKLHIPQI